MQPKDWINVVQICVALFGVGVALYIALRREKKDQQNEYLKRAERYSELFVVPIAIADIVAAEMESILKELLEPYWVNGWGAPANLEARCDRLISEFAEIPLRTMPTRKSVEQLWHIQKCLQIAKGHLLILGSLKEEIKSLTNEKVEQARQALEQVRIEATELRSELVRATAPTNT